MQELFQPALEHESRSGKAVSLHAFCLDCKMPIAAACAAVIYEVTGLLTAQPLNCYYNALTSQSLGLAYADSKCRFESCNNFLSHPLLQTYI